MMQINAKMSTLKPMLENMQEMNDNMIGMQKSMHWMVSNIAHADYCIRGNACNGYHTVGTVPKLIPLTHPAHFPGLVDVFIDTSNTHCSLSWLGRCVYRYL